MVDSDPVLLEAPQQVLSTMNPDGSRRWLLPRLAKGRWWKRRRVLAWSLILLFNVLPWVSIGGRPAILLDVMDRQFSFFGAEFQPTETLLLTFLLLSIFLGIFLLTALLGRVWCGWGCPQTVYLEFLYRPLERLIEGRSWSRGAKSAPKWRIALKYLVFGIVSLHLSHTFLSYFVGGPQVVQWSLGSPGDHPVGFAIVWGVALSMMIDFAWFREQMCILACPYGRFQSVLLDRNSLIIGYDARRGERRGKLGSRKDAGGGWGDCVDCGLCVAACPTGIDIRDGLQMECVACAECIDACDTVMAKVGKPPGLIRYSSQNALSGAPLRWLRPRTVLYPLFLAIALGAFGWNLSHRQSALVQALRQTVTPYTVLEDGSVRNVMRFRVDNRSQQTRSYHFALQEGYDMQISPDPLRVAAGASGMVAAQFLVPRARFVDGRTTIHLRVWDGVDFDRTREYHLLGPLSFGD